MANLVGLALEEGDPRRPKGDVAMGPGTALSTAHKLHDPNVSFEEYLYHARMTRADERYEDLNPDYNLFGIKLKKNRHGHESAAETISQVTAGGVSAPAATYALGRNSPDEKSAKLEGSPHGAHMVIADSEYIQASRALRTAGWSSIFFLLTTDILGPFNAPTAMAYVRQSSMSLYGKCAKLLIRWATGLALYFTPSLASSPPTVVSCCGRCSWVSTPTVTR